MHTPINPFKQALAAGRTQIGLWAALASPHSTGLLAGIGYDLLLIDGEHAPNDVRSTLAQLQAMASAQQAFGNARSHPVVRLPIGTGELGVTLIEQYLDLGAQTLLVPLVDTPEQAAQVVAATRYAPAGVRGMGSALARLTLAGPYARCARGRRADLRAGAGRDGVRHGAARRDCRHRGRRRRLDRPGRPQRQHGLPGRERPSGGASRDCRWHRAHPRRGQGAPGIVATREPDARRWIDAGARFVAVGADTLLLGHGAADLRARYR